MKYKLTQYQKDAIQEIRDNLARSIAETGNTNPAYQTGYLAALHHITKDLGLSAIETDIDKTRKKA